MLAIIMTAMVTPCKTKKQRCLFLLDMKIKPAFNLFSAPRASIFVHDFSSQVTLCNSKNKQLPFNVISITYL